MRGKRIFPGVNFDHLWTKQGENASRAPKVALRADLTSTAAPLIRGRREGRTRRGWSGQVGSRPHRGAWITRYGRRAHGRGRKIDRFFLSTAATTCWADGQRHDHQSYRDLRQLHGDSPLSARLAPPQTESNGQGIEGRGSGCSLQPDQLYPILGDRDAPRLTFRNAERTPGLENCYNRHVAYRAVVRSAWKAGSPYSRTVAMLHLSQLGAPICKTKPLMAQQKLP